MLATISSVCLFFLNNIVIKYTRKKTMFHSKRERLQAKYIPYTYYLTNFTRHDEFARS